MHEEHADAVLERLNEELEWREAEFAGVSACLAEVASDVDDWLCDRDYVRIEEALKGLPWRRVDGSRSLLEEMALLAKIRDGAGTQAGPSSPGSPLPQLTRELLAAIPLPADEDDEESFDFRERFEEETAADHLRAVLRYAETHWEEAWSAAQKADTHTAFRELDATRAALTEVDAAYTLWFECLGVLCEVSPAAAGIAGEMVKIGMAAFRHATLHNRSN